MSPIDNPQATAVFRRSGLWSISLGPEGIIHRLVKKSSTRPMLERRLGILASSVAALTATAFDEVGIPTHTIRVYAYSSFIHENASNSHHLQLRISIECEADSRTVQAQIDSRVLSDPLFTLLAADAATLDIQVEAHSSAHVRIP